MCVVCSLQPKQLGTLWLTFAAVAREMWGPLPSQADTGCVMSPWTWDQPSHPGSRVSSVKWVMKDFYGGPVVKNLSANAGDMGSIPGPGKIPHATEQLRPCASTRE